MSAVAVETEVQRNRKDKNDRQHLYGSGWTATPKNQAKGMPGGQQKYAVKAFLTRLHCLHQI